jgi:predicted MPP superfamily phosphohydrolase
MRGHDDARATPTPRHVAAGRHRDRRAGRIAAAAAAASFDGAAASARMLPMASAAPLAVARRWLRLWLIVLNAGLLLAAAALGLLVSRRAYFLVLLVPLATVPFSYARLRLHDDLARALHATPRLLGVLVAIGVALDAILIGQLLTGRAAGAVPLLQGPGVNWVGPVWFSAHALLFVAYAVAGIVRVLHRGGLALWSRRPPAAPRPVEQVASPGRRELLQHAGLVGAALPFFVSLSSVPLSYDLRVEPRELVVPRWPRELDGLRIAHLSDIHVGGGMNHARLRRMAELVNEARPDLVLHTGDFLTHRSGEFDTPLYQALARIRAPYGQWACLGNHDYDDPDRITRRLADSGVTLLRDRLATFAIEGHALEIVGTDFVFARERHAEAYGELFARLSPRGGAPRILLNHDPRGFFALPADAADLVLSGHTHGGHIGVQLSQSHAITVVGLVGIPDQGVFARGDMRLFVTRCVGFYGYPMRLGIPPEIALLTLRAPSAVATHA